MEMLNEFLGSRFSAYVVGVLVGYWARAVTDRRDRWTTRS